MKGLTKGQASAKASQLRRLPRMVSKPEIDKVLKIAQAQHARNAELHDPAYIGELKKDAAAFRVARHH